MSHSLHRVHTVSRASRAFQAPSPQTARGRLSLACLASVAAVVALFSMSGVAQAKLSAVGPTDTGNHFPSYYEDSNKLRLEPCLTGAPRCFAAAADLVAPDGEAFYNNATANLTTRGNGKAVMVLAL